MNGNRVWRIVAFMSISIGVGILSHAAWGFIVFGVLVLIDTFIFKSQPSAPSGRGLVGTEATEDSIAFSGRSVREQHLRMDWRGVAVARGVAA